METASVVIATFGDRAIWNPLADRALKSVMRQTRMPDEIFRIHGKDLCEARNLGGRMASSTWLCFLDADDELHWDYLESMLCGSGDLRYPMIYIQGRGIVDPYAGRPLLEGNYLAIGTLISKDMFMDVGGFPKYEAYEDWAMWLRCEALGARAHVVPGAIYFAHQNQTGRNRSHLYSKEAMKVRVDFLKWKVAKCP